MLNSLSYNSRSVILSFLLFIVSSFWSFLVIAENEITVKSGQTIIKIMRQVYPDQRSRWPILMREIVKDNPSAFINGDPRTLKVGSVIKLPENSTVAVKQETKVRAATVKSISGSVTLFDEKKTIRQIAAGSEVHVGDQLLTSDSGSLVLNFVDGTILDLRCNSLLNINDYKMRTRGSVSDLSLLKGSLRTKTGRIGRSGSDQSVLKTPEGNITTKKAEYGVRVHQVQACEKQADVETDGLYVAVLNGEVSVNNEAGKIALSSGDAAVVVQKNIAPVITLAFSGMVFGDKIVTEPVVVKSLQPEMTRQSSDDTIEEDNGVPVWWMIAGAVILGISF